jgi:hypothetical protein
MHVYYNFRCKESEEKRMSDLMLLFPPLKMFDLLYSRVGAGAASKFSPEPEPHKNDAAPQHWYAVLLVLSHSNEENDRDLQGFLANDQYLAMTKSSISTNLLYQRSGNTVTSPLSISYTLKA